MDPPLLYSSHQPSSLTTQHKHAKTLAVLLPSENQTDQGLRLPISWKHSLNITAHSVPALCAPKGSYVKSNFFWIDNFDFFLLLFFHCQGLLPYSIVVFLTALSHRIRALTKRRLCWISKAILFKKYIMKMCHARQTRAIRRGPQTFMKVVEMCLHEFQLAALVALSWSAFPCHSSKLSLFPCSTSGLVGISIAQSKQPKGQLLLAFEIY